MFPLGIFLSYILSFFKFQSFIANQPKLLATKKVTIEKDGLRWVSGEESLFQSWADITSSLFLFQHIFILLKNSFVFIPRRSFLNKDDFIQWREAIKQKKIVD